jgi:hypothetical protein
MSGSQSIQTRLKSAIVFSLGVTGPVMTLMIFAEVLHRLGSGRWNEHPIAPNAMFLAKTWIISVVFFVVYRSLREKFAPPQACSIDAPFRRAAKAALALFLLTIAGASVVDAVKGRGGDVRTVIGTSILAFVPAITYFCIFYFFARRHESKSSLKTV